eukprot:1079911-Pyramimonas_sp.AAC.1
MPEKWVARTCCHCSFVELSHFLVSEVGARGALQQPMKGSVYRAIIAMGSLRGNVIHPLSQQGGCDYTL